MGRTVYAEERLHAYLTSLSKSDKYVIGLILGQSTGQKDYVVHLAKTPPPLTKNIVEETIMSPTSNTQQDDMEKCIKCMKDIQEGWVADHAKHVTRMLPGGMWVLGAFIVGPEDIFNNTNNIQKLRSILTAIHKSLSSNKYLCGNSNEEKLILNLNSITEKYTCKSMDVGQSSTLKPVDWKFQPKATKWHQLETLVDFNRLFFVPTDKNPETLKQQLQDILENVSEVVDSAVVVIANKFRSPDDALEIITKHRKEETACKSNDKNRNGKVLQIHLYIPCSKNQTSEVRITSCTASIRLVGQLVSRTFVHQKASVAEASQAVKQDIIRSLATRLIMHWDSLIEEETGSPEENITLHEPPRRVLVALPESKVTLSDYLFPGEGPQEALVSLQELLDLEVQESNVQKDIELQADPLEFYCQSEIDAKPAESIEDLSAGQHMAVYVAGFTVAFLVLIVAVLVHRLY